MAVHKKRNYKRERAARNKKAFDEIVGDPYGYPEPIEGQYSAFKRKGSIRAMEYSAMSSPSPTNKAKPNAMDFFCDVERVIDDGLIDYFGESNLKSAHASFISTYITEDGSPLTFTQAERVGVEQAIGKLLVARKISPVTKYFSVIKK